MMRGNLFSPGRKILNKYQLPHRKTAGEPFAPAVPSVGGGIIVAEASR